MSRASIAHLTSVHSRYDTRIFHKMCRSLVAADCDVSLVVADGKGDEVSGVVKIFDVGKANGRLDRMVGMTRRVVERGLELDADIYHLHDPELLPMAMKLKRCGRRVIFDAHEDLPRQILSKHYIHPAFRGPIARSAGWIERLMCRRLDHVVAATPVIRQTFIQAGIDATTVANFPILDELVQSSNASQKANQVCYVGGITAVRGLREMVDAMAIVKSDTRLQLAGSFGEIGLHDTASARPGWGRVDELGFLDRERVRDVLASSVAGLVPLHPTRAYLDSLPVKMFEYMSAGLPVIASNFPLWREIVEGNACGICVDPLNPGAIAAAIDQLVGNPDLARQMGENGRKAVHERYNWGLEEKKLFALYKSLLGTS